jgi:predicted RNase H-like nuclease (RuvC/YqgF family)
MYLKNKLKGQISKAQKVDNENIKKENELNNKIINQIKTEVIRNQINNNNQKKKMAEIKKKEELIKNLEEKINLENKKKKELEEEMKKLNIIETEILGRIYANNEMQRKLIENFEKNFGHGFGNNNDVIMSLNNINNSYLNSSNGLEQFYEDIENNYE